MAKANIKIEVYAEFYKCLWGKHLENFRVKSKFTKIFWNDIKNEFLSM